MIIYAKLSTAITIPFGPVLDSIGAEYTGAVVGEVKISKNNGTPAALNGSATLTHREVGIYELVLTTSDISAVGQATLTLSKTTYVAPPVTLIVLPAKVYDSLVGGTDNLEVDAIQWLGTACATPTVAGVPEVDVTHFNGIAGTFASGRPEVNTSHVGGTSQTAGDLAALINTLDDFVDTEVAAIKAKTDQLTFTSANKVDANLAAINADTGGIAGLDRAARAITIGTVGVGSTTTSIVTSSITPTATAADQFKGLILKFAKDTTTAALRGQGTDITASTAGGVLTVTALTTAPASGDTFTVE
jgi:hypothetical protein